MNALLQESLDQVQRRLAAHGPAGARVLPERVVVALDADNTTQVWVTVLPAMQLVSVQVRSTYRVARAAWPTVLRLVNEWNRRNRLTSAWLQVEDWELAGHGGIVVEATLPVSEAHRPAEVADFVDAAIAEAQRFWQVVTG